MTYDVISIDGPTGSGKTSIGKLLSEELNCKFISSGFLYRTLANSFIEYQATLDSYTSSPYWEHVYNLLSENTLEVRILELGKDKALIEFNNLEHQINKTIDISTKDNYKAKITDVSSNISKFTNIRNSVNTYLKDYVSKSALTVVEGRDIGSVVFKDAKLKIYIDSPLELRAKRRLNQSSNEEGIEDIVRRDTSDTTRKNSPLIIPDGSIIIVNENQSIADIVELILEEYQKL